MGKRRSEIILQSLIHEQKVIDVCRDLSLGTYWVKECRSERWSKVALVEELNAETEEWIRGTGVALDVASAADAGKRVVFFPFRFECRWHCELSRICSGRNG